MTCLWCHSGRPAVGDYTGFGDWICEPCLVAETAVQNAKKESVNVQ